ncbi:aminotransferase class V-fold PLP-dependent enzyme [Rhodovarius crocodyli]|uniref:Aminotransferase class V-fold PLP-dependent enzyme n=1 Tax=Rhodovarius crocodyli TaxID=1979269 RepID=A0A437MGA9_9PROT|nr:aminotransferase class V-fold PLP-dependent enzyme [Rhodovarius crocodyli]RVT96693.1 aminotransferase class V-fold PLP-dependent enzyme [Rhodovarius crocodyli]
MNAIQKPRGRMFFANPGPTNIPDSVMRAVSHASIDFNDADFFELYERCVAGLKRVLRTKQHLFFYTASGHGAWEASMANLFNTGDTLLVIETGHFSESWAKMGKALGLCIDTLPADWRKGADFCALRAKLAGDTEHRIKAVCAVHNETAAGTMLDIGAVRAAMDAAGHPALLLADTISSLASLPFEMDAWGVDVVVGGSQKGLMLPTGFSFTGVSEKALEAHKGSRIPKHYFDWSEMLTRRHRSFIGTVPTTLFYGLAESLRLLEEEGLEQVWARHTRLARAVRAAVKHWSGNGPNSNVGGPELYCQDDARASDSVTAILMPDGHDADAVRATCRNRFNVSLGAGLNKLAGRVFRIGHLGDLNEPMVLGTLASVEMALKLNNVPHRPGGVAAAMEELTA